MSEISAQDKNPIFNDYIFSDTFFNESTGNQNSRRVNQRYAADSDDYIRESYTIPYEDVVKHVLMAEKAIVSTRDKIQDSLLRRINVNPYVDPDLEEAHFRVWDEFLKMRKSTSQSEVIEESAPDHICFDQYMFAEKLGSSSAKRLVEEYHNAISHSTFSYLFIFRKLLNLIYNELICIKTSIYTDFGGGYDNESQQKVGAQYYSWSKMAAHYAERISKAIVSKSDEIPLSEVDKVSAKQAAQLQTVFAIKLNAIDSEIQNLVSSLEADMRDNCEVFYSNYLSPSIKLNKEITYPIEVDFVTERMRDNIPFLAGEIFVASTVLKGNFVSVFADYIERMSNLRDKADLVMMYVREKRKYSNFINQLSVKGAKKKPIIVQTEDNTYENLFKYTFMDNISRQNYSSDHSRLDGLLNNDHPQYLLKDGDSITGNITVGPGVTIDNVDVSDHAHTGSDGSVKIKATDIDYTSTRNSDGSSINSGISNKEIDVSIIEFVPEIIDGGIPVCDVVLNISVDDSLLENHEFEITFVEV